MDIRDIIKEVHSKINNGNELSKLYTETITNKKIVETLGYKLFGKEIVWLNKDDKNNEIIKPSFNDLIYVYYMKEFKESYNSGRLYSATISKLIPADSSLEDLCQFLMNIEGYIEMEDVIGVIEKNMETEIKTESKDGVILVFYMDKEVYNNKEILNQYSQGVTKGLEQIGLKGMMFFLPTDGPEHIDCINPKFVDAKVFEETKEKLHKLSMKLDIELKG